MDNSLTNSGTSYGVATILCILLSIYLIMEITTIVNHLQELEKERNITILMAVESGSRAWGFPSPDSDYDVRIIYLRDTNWYLSIIDKKDTINYFHGELLDINGWDMRKALGLLKKSNATPFEWAQSPICYMEKVGFRKQLLDFARQFFQPYHTINHYKGIAKNSYASLDATGKIKLKKLFYVIRPLLAIEWILTKHTLPPMDIFSLMNGLEKLPIREKILELIRIKADKNEDYQYLLEPVVANYLEAQFEKLQAIPYPAERKIPDVEVLNNFFRTTLLK